MFRAAIFSILAVIFSGISISTQAGERPAGQVLQVAQASPVTKFRGLSFGMSEAEVRSALAALGFTTELRTMPLGEQVTTIVKDGNSHGRVYFSENKKLNKLSLEANFFGFYKHINIKDFVGQLSSAYNGTNFRKEMRSTMVGDMWMYVGKTQNGETLTVADPTGQGSPAVRIDPPAQRGIF